MPRPEPIDSLDLSIRVAYHECDPMNVAHHSVNPIWMEQARTELLRRRGRAYRDLEAAGIYFVVARLQLRYHRPARYDDILRIHIDALPDAGVKIDHKYTIHRDAELLATGQTTIVCVWIGRERCRRFRPGRWGECKTLADRNRLAEDLPHTNLSSVYKNADSSLSNAPSTPRFNVTSPATTLAPTPSIL